MIAQWTSWTDCVVTSLDQYMSASNRTRSCRCENCMIYCFGPTVERRKCAEIEHCRQQVSTASVKSTSCPVSKWHLMIEACTCRIGVQHTSGQFTKKLKK